MMGPIKIGFLTPYSGVYPFYGQHLMAGIYLGLFPGTVNLQEVQFVPAYTNKGDAKSVQEAVNKLVFFDQVDIVSGLISYKSIPDIIPVIESYNKLAFFFDMGEYIPYFNHLSPRIFYSSQQIWQSEYALGRWAYKEYGGTGLMVMPVYEAGYHLSGAFHKGASDAGSTEMRLHVIPKDPSNVRGLNMDGFFAELKKNPPSYVHAVFSGNMGNEFLTAWRTSPYHKIPLTVVENMVYDDLLEDVASLDLELYAGITWNRHAEGLRNKEFVKAFERRSGGQIPNIYTLLGYEAGLVLKEVKPLILKRDWNKVMDLLQKESIQGPRGERNFFPLSGFSLPVIDIIRIKTSANKIYKTIVSQGNGLKFDSVEFEDIHNESISGWQNPYLCI